MSKFRPIVKDVTEIRKLENGLKEYRVSVELRASYKTGTPYTPLRRTRKKHKEEIDIFTDHVISLWSLYPYIHVKNLEAFLMNPIKEEFSDSQLRDYYMHGEIISSVIGICIDEFQNFLYEIQIGAYNGAIRTLRYILEVTIDCCLFQTDNKSHTHKQLKKIAITKENIISYMNYHNNWVSFIERYKLYEDTRRIAPTFKEKINRISSKNLFLEVPILSSKIKDMYSRLSNYIHPNIQRIKKHIIRNTLPPPNYDEKEFNNAYQIGLEIIDMVIYIFLKTTSHYYGFKDGKECVNDYAKHMKMSKKGVNNHFDLDYTSKLCKDITWQLLEVSDNKL